jgi:RimJ/RimL family protein N-acetyltransferase
MGASKIANCGTRLFPDGFERTGRLTLTPLQAADAFQLVVLTNDPLVAAGVSLLRQPFTLADAQELISLPRDGKGCFAAIRLSQDRAGGNGPFIGCVGALVRDHIDVELGFWLGVPYHGRHYGEEAAQAMLARLRRTFPDRRIVAECPRENSASWRLLQRLGFSPSGASGTRKGAQLLAYKAPEAVS